MPQLTLEEEQSFKQELEALLFKYGAEMRISTTIQLIKLDEETGTTKEDAEANTETKDIR